MDSNSTEIKAMQDELKWITLKEEEENTFWAKTKSKSMADPIVPIGAMVTFGVLSVGIYNYIKKNHIKQQKMMKLRVLAQGVTLAAIFISMYRSGKFN